MSTKYQIGDLVKPNEKAFKRNKEFTSDKRFIVTSIDENKFLEERKNWYQLATKDAKHSTFCLPEDELSLVKVFEWIF